MTLRHRAGAWGLLAIAAICALGPLFAADPLAIRPDAAYQEPSAAYLLGTDGLGRDVLARLLVGGRVSLIIAFLSTLLATLVGGSAGVIAGYAGGRLDQALLRVVEGIRAVPRLPLLMLLLMVDLRGWFGLKTAPLAAYVLRLVLVLTLFGWTTAARLARAKARELRAAGFVLAARGFGASHAYVLFRHVLPHALGPLAVAATIDLGEVVVYENVLSFLGLGIREPYPSWGSMLAQGLSGVALAPHLAVLPGLVTAVTIACVVLAGEGLTDRLETPRRS